MISNEDKLRIIDEVDGAMYRGLTKRQNNLLRARLHGVTQNQVRKALDTQASRDRFSLEGLLQDLERVARSNKADDKRPEHLPSCEHGCEGEGWVPGPAEQYSRMRDGEPFIRLSRCPGRALTDAVWEGVRDRWEDYQTPASLRDVSELMLETKLAHGLPKSSEDSS